MLRFFPWSVTKISGATRSQPIRHMERRSAETGPVALFHCLLASVSAKRALASCKVAAILRLGCQPSHHAAAQVLAGRTCASNAGSVVPFCRSYVARTRSTFLPAPSAAIALAVRDLHLCKRPSAMPQTSTPYVMVGVSAALAI